MPRKKEATAKKKPKDTDKTIGEVMSEMSFKEGKGALIPDTHGLIIGFPDERAVPADDGSGVSVFLQWTEFLAMIASLQPYLINELSKVEAMTIGNTSTVSKHSH